MIVKQKTPVRREWPGQNSKNTGAPTTLSKQQGQQSDAKPPLQRKAKAQSSAKKPKEQSLALPNGVRSLAESRPRAKGRAPWVPIVLEALRVMPNYSYAARTAGISYQAIQDRRRRNPAFQRQCELAIEEGIAALEIACWKRATVGWKKPIWQRDEKGRPIKVDDEVLFDGKLAETLLRAHAPQKYSPKFQAELSGPNGGQLFAPVVAPTQVQIIIPDNGRGAIEVQATSSPVQIAQAPAQLPQQSPPEPAPAPAPPAETPQERRARIEIMQLRARNARAMERIRATHPEPPPVEPFSGGTL